MSLQLDMPVKMVELLFDQPGQEKPRNRVAYGGRGASKSWGFADGALAYGIIGYERFLCCREYQNSIADSVHAVLRDRIEHYELAEYVIRNLSIYNEDNGTEFIFEGLHHNVTKIKSMEGITKCWVEEAEKVSKDSWRILLPTIRAPGSEIWVGFNPELETQETYQRFVVSPPPRTRVMEINWQDNPWFPTELREQMEYDYRVDPDAAEWVWGGKTRKNSAAAVLRNKWSVDAFEAVPDWDGPYFGADFGFSTDPSTLVKCWITKQRKLMIEHEAYGVGIELDDMPAFYDQVPGSRQHRIYGDNSRPETISHIAQRGFNIRSCDKWPGSVEDGITFLRSFEQIVIHDRCKHAASEARLWSYKEDKNTGDVLPVLVDKHNHIWDAVRYALGPMIKQGGGILQYYKEEVAEQKKRNSLSAAELMGALNGG